MTSKQLRRILQSIVVTAPAATWLACGHSQSGLEDIDGGGHDASVQDAPTDAPADAKVVVPPPPSDVDATVYWCDAGPPVNVRGSLCYNYFYVPCGLPAETYLRDAASADSGPLNQCEQVCANVQRFDCALLNPTQVEQSHLDATAGTANAEAGIDPDAVYVVCGCSAIGRRPRGLCRPTAKGTSPLAEYFANAAFLEAASVPAFTRLHAELAAMSAPLTLLASVDRAIRDEQRHARIVGRVARRYGAAVSAPRVRPFRRRSVVSMAIENTVEGCVRETYGALVALWQAAHAADPAIRRVMRVIAEDEIRHASLSWRVAGFLERRLTERERARVIAARTRGVAELRKDARRAPAEVVVGVAGMPDVANASALLEDMQAALWAS